VATEKHVVVLNGDTIFKASLEESNLLAISHLAECSLLLKPMKNIDRYGIVEINEKNEITAFKEKKSYKEGLINAGCYILNVQDFLSANFPEVFSFEKDYLERFFGKKRIYGIQQDAYFIDIGIPEDYYRAQQEICHPAVDLKRVDKDWTLLLDRDGVINEEKRGGYILNWKEFKFFPDAKKSFSTLAQKFGKIIIVTNQRGVGKGDIPEETLHTIHENMKSEIEKVGGRIDMILYCASTDNLHPNRKPNPGMMFLAKKYYPEIELSKTIMVGNKLSDMAFAKNAGIFSVFLATTDPETAFPHPYIDLRFNSLEEFTSAL
jgi:D-glycero-alpha-D-manno-heptose 1-phosphate guanylyltransferase